jgi:hypothetical protein
MGRGRDHDHIPKGAHPMYKMPILLAASVLAGALFLPAPAAAVERAPLPGPVHGTCPKIPQEPQAPIPNGPTVPNAPVQNIPAVPNAPVPNSPELPKAPDGAGLSKACPAT